MVVEIIDPACCCACCTELSLSERDLVGDEMSVRGAAAAVLPAFILPAVWAV